MSGLINPKPVFSKEKFFLDLPVVAAGLVTVSHGLGVKPDLSSVKLTIKFKAAKNGFSIGDEVFDLPMGSGGADGFMGLVCWVDEVNIYVRIGHYNANVFSIHNKNTGTMDVLTGSDVALNIRVLN